MANIVKNHQGYIQATQRDVEIPAGAIVAVPAVQRARFEEAICETPWVASEYKL